MAATTKNTTPVAAGGAVAGIFSAVEAELAATVERASADALAAITEAKELALADVSAVAVSGAKLTVTSGGVARTVTGLKHESLRELIAMVGQRMPVLLVGMAGTGKTHATEQAAEALGLPFYAMSVGAQTSKSDIIGYMSAGGTYVPTLFRKAYEGGEILAVTGRYFLIYRVLLTSR